MVIKSVGVLSVGKMLGCLYAVFGLIVGAFVALLSIVGVAAAGDRDGAAGMLLGVGMVVIAPLIYGVIGFILGIIMAAVYNLVAGIAGGIEINLVQAAGDYDRGGNRESSLRDEMD